MPSISSFFFIISRSRNTRLLCVKRSISTACWICSERRLEFLRELPASLAVHDHALLQRRTVRDRKKDTYGQNVIKIVNKKTAACADISAQTA